MDQREEKINGLLLDNRFVDWVTNPQSSYMEYWLQWINTSKENAELAIEAKHFLLELRIAENEVAKEINEGITEQILINIKEVIKEDSSLVLMQRSKGNKRWYWMAAAAITVLVVFLGITFLKPSDHHLSSVIPTKEIPSSPEVIRYNGSEKNEVVFLPDGSKITLAKGGRISYNRLMNGKKRNVSLTGEAFFDVAKNPEKPFYIYTQNMVIKVLGTSFRVNASAKTESVIVNTGRVSVYMKGQDLEQSAAKILLPRQACTYSFASKELITTNYSSPAKIEMQTEDVNKYRFEDAPLDTIFKTIEKMYSLPVYYDKEVFKNCFITISLEDESLEKKLEVITKTVSASFSISDYGINIQGKGCN